MREIEVKLRVKSLANLEKNLKKAGYTLSKPINQHDTIYSFGNNVDKWTETKEGDIVVRIRHQDNFTEFNLKKQKSNESDNIECETKIESPEAMHQALLLMGYQPIVEVRKVRRKGKVGGFEICLDQVEKLGEFVELEKLTEDNVDAEKVRAELFKVLESFGLSKKDEEVQGYDNLIYQLKNK